ncbi:putative deleted in malignant brain tumors 1 protein-like [Apostichopus japonicus]|uniref:Putative deleted in malignant brain tumors 1 protein-like n=1 Tax=Stichopus japonicus TaxID=307972 RepID=A0A2G8K608_STIJA|nr:putative deleted in malignant brain tumors 1 protein-like [Apostichopus japonicus]
MFLIGINFLTSLATLLSAMLPLVYTQGNGDGAHNCGHHEDAGVKCVVPVRLVDGTADYEGRIEIFLNGAWGTICDDSWGKDEADVACRQLGYSAAEAATSSASYGQGTGQIWLDDVQCIGSEEHIFACNNRGVGVHNCGHGEDAGVKCVVPEVRLVGGTTDYEGRIEIFLNGAWGTICDDSWGIDEAEVACRQLGYSKAVEAFSFASYGAGTGEILLDDVQCIGSEEHILACQNRGVGVHDCGHYEDAGVKCEIPMRLVNGEGIHTGRVELFMNGEWGTVDEDPWDDTDAGVVCRELGFPYGGTGYRSAHFGQGTGPIWIDEVNCEGQETSLLQCPHQTDTSEDSHAEDVGVACNGLRAY